MAKTFKVGAIEFPEMSKLQTLAHYQPLNLAQISIPAKWA